MSLTRHSLLHRAQRGEERAWLELTFLYRPLITGWLTYQSIPGAEVEDQVQEILLSVVQSLPTFAHSGRSGAFRAWLRTITYNSVCDYWKARSRRVLPAGDPAAEAALARLEDSREQLDEVWDREHDRYVLRCLVDLLEMEFEPKTVQVFRRLALEGASSVEVARELDLSVGAVYVAKSRVLQRLREEARGLIDVI